jgi:hypothetical protein
VSFGKADTMIQLLNIITSTLGALRNLQYPVDPWDPVILHGLQRKLDSQLRAQWELSVDTTVDPTVTEFTTFLTKFSKSAIASEGKKVSSEKPSSKIAKSYRTTTLYSGTPTKTASKSEFASRQGDAIKKVFKCQVCGAQPGHLFINSSISENSDKVITPPDERSSMKRIHECVEQFVGLLFNFSFGEKNVCKRNRYINVYPF